MLSIIKKLCVYVGLLSSLSVWCMEDHSNGKVDVWYALECMKIDRVKELLSDGRDVKVLFSEWNDEGLTLLHYAVLRDKPEVIAFFLKLCGIDVNINDRFGNTPLRLAYVVGNELVINLLVQAGADEHLIESESDSDKADFLNGRLLDALERKDICMVRTALLMGADCNYLVRDRRGVGTFVIGHAALYMNNALLELLLEFGERLNPDLLDYVTQSPIQQAGAQKNLGAVFLLIMFGAFCDVSNPAAFALLSKLFVANELLSALDDYNVELWQEILRNYEKRIRASRSSVVSRVQEAFLFAACQRHRKFISYVLKRIKLPVEICQEAFVVAALNNYEDIVALLSDHVGNDLSDETWCVARSRALRLAIGQGHRDLAIYLYNQVILYDNCATEIEHARTNLLAILRNPQLSCDRREVYQDLGRRLFRMNFDERYTLPYTFDWLAYLREDVFSFAYLG